MVARARCERAGELPVHDAQDERRPCGPVYAAGRRRASGGGERHTDRCFADGAWPAERRCPRAAELAGREAGVYRGSAAHGRSAGRKVLLAHDAGPYRAAVRDTYGQNTLGATLSTAQSLAEGATPPDATAGGGQRRLGLALLVIATAQLMVVLDAAIVNVALPHIQRALGFTGSGLEWGVTASALTLAGLPLLPPPSRHLLGPPRTFIPRLLP